MACGSAVRGMIKKAEPNAKVTVHDDLSGVTVECPDGCDPEKVAAAVTGKFKASVKQ